MARTAVAIAVIALLAFPSAARAADRPIAGALTVAPPDECIDGSSLAPLVEAWLGRGAIAGELGVSVEAAGGTASFAVLRDGRTIASRSFERLPASWERSD